MGILQKNQNINLKETEKLVICSVTQLFNSKMIHIICAVSNYLRRDDYQEHSKTFKLYSLIVFYYTLLICYVHQSGWLNANQYAMHCNIDRNIQGSITVSNTRLDGSTVNMSPFIFQLSVTAAGLKCCGKSSRCGSLMLI